MRTRTVSTDHIDEIVDALRGDQVVALPTETVYGLAARAASQEAVERIFAVKGRPTDNPLIVHASSMDDAFALAGHVPDYARRLARRFWPGPLSLVFRSAVDWPWVQAGHPTIAVRVPEPAYLREVIRRVGPLAAPSANLSGRPSPTTAAHCQADLGGAVPLIVDGGPCERGVESTVVDCTGPAPAILRPGPVTAEMIERFGEASGPPGAAASPGTRHPHYRPRARVVIVDDATAVEDPEGMTITPGRRIPLERGEGGSGSTPRRRTYGSLDEFGRNLYAWLREADELGVRTIYVERVSEEGLGVAIMNRLRKAAQPQE